MLANSAYGKSTMTEVADYRERHYQNLLGVLRRYSDITLNRIREEAPELDASLRYLFFDTKPSDEYLYDWFTVEPIAVQEIIDADPIIRGLHRYENLAPQEDSARRIDQVRAIARVTARFLDLGHGIEHDVDDDGFNISYIEDVGLCNLLTTHENPGAVTDLIIQRDITDAQQLTALIDAMGSTANPITNGML